MRKSGIIAVVVASLVSTAAFAGAQAPAAGAQTGRHAMSRGMKDGARGHRGAMRGVKLSAAEQAKLKDVHGRYAAEGKSLRESLKPAMQEARAARQKGDTAAARAAWSRNKAGLDKLQALHAREQTDIRSALSPENQKAFDANTQQMAKRRAEWKANGKAGPRARKGGIHRPSTSPTG